MRFTPQLVDTLEVAHNELDSHTELTPAEGPDCTQLPLQHAMAACQFWQASGNDSEAIIILYTYHVVQLAYQSSQASMHVHSPITLIWQHIDEERHGAINDFG